MTINPAIKETALGFADKYYPDAECVILTGSQIEPDFVNSQSDIDIVLIGSRFNSVSSDGIKDGQHKIDFTKLGYSNILDILIDVSYSSSPIVLNMIGNGIILRDRTGIGALAKEYCRNALLKGNRNANNEVKSLMHGLFKLKKHLLKNLDDRYNLFLAGDFLKLISSAYLFLYNEGWYAPDGFRLVKKLLIKDRKSSFLNDLLRLGRDFIEKPHENVQLLLMYIDKYINLLGRTGDSAGFENKLILNINFRDQDPECFFGDICSAILDHPYLSKYFLIGHIHDFRYIFKNRYCLVFDNGLEGYDELLLIKEIENIFFKQRRRILDMSIVNPAYLFELCEDGNILGEQEALLSYINKEIIGLVDRERSYNRDKMFLLGIIISTAMLRAFDMTNEDIRTLFDSLMRKWLPWYHSNSTENHFSAAYLKNGSVYDEIRERFIGRTGTLDGGVDLNMVLNRSGSIAEAVANSTAKLPDLCLLSLQTDKPVFWHLSNTLEMTLDTMGIEHKDRSYFAYVVKQLYS